MKNRLSAIDSVLDILPSGDYQKLLDDRTVQASFSDDFCRVLEDMNKSLQVEHALRHVQDKYASVIDKLAAL